MTIKDVVVGSTYRVLRVKGQGALRRRILDMGLTKGTNFLVKRSAPMGDPVQISLRNYELSIRKEDGQLVEIEKA